MLKAYLVSITLSSACIYQKPRILKFKPILRATYHPPRIQEEEPSCLVPCHLHGALSLQWSLNVLTELVKSVLALKRNVTKHCLLVLAVRGVQIFHHLDIILFLFLRIPTNSPGLQQHAPMTLFTPHQLPLLWNRDILQDLHPRKHMDRVYSILPSMFLAP